MRRTSVVLFALVGILLIGAAAAQVVAIRSTASAPARACVPSAPLVLAFGEPRGREAGGLEVPVFAQNVGDATERVLVSAWSVDIYRVRWDGRLSPLGSQSVDVDFIAGYAGEDVAPGERTQIGEAQIAQSGDTVRLIAFANDACGDATISR